MTAALTPRRLMALALLVMASAIGGAWAFQLLGDFPPCPLCLRQRTPYYIAIPLAALALLPWPRLISRLLALSAAGVMVWGASMGVSHAGAEWGLWDATCPAGESVRDASDLMSAIEGAGFVSCTDVQGRVLGLSFAGWNAVAASGSALALVTAAVRR